MKMYVINEKFGRVSISILEVRETQKLYKVMRRIGGERNFYGVNINKETLDKFSIREREVITKDVEKGLEVFLEGMKYIEEQKKKELERIRESIRNIENIKESKIYI